jgi:hypothetical protein
MNKIEIKKEIERQTPIAEVDFERGDYIHYSTLIVVDGVEEIISFEVPMTQDPNMNELPAKLLIDWMV